jgi:hypothetical protein
MASVSQAPFIVIAHFYEPGYLSVLAGKSWPRRTLPEDRLLLLLLSGGWIHVDEIICLQFQISSHVTQDLVRRGPLIRIGQ